MVSVSKRRAVPCYQTDKTGVQRRSGCRQIELADGRGWYPWNRADLRQRPDGLAADLLKRCQNFEVGQGSRYQFQLGRQSRIFNILNYTNDTVSNLYQRPLFDAQVRSYSSAVFQGPASGGQVDLGR